MRSATQIHTPPAQRIAVTIALHPDEYDYMVKGGRCDDCGHLQVLRDDEGVCRVCGCREHSHEAG